MTFYTPSLLLSVLFCTLLAQAQSDDERAQIEGKMAEDSELAVYLRALQETEREDLVTQERDRREKNRKSKVEAHLEGMDLDGGEVGGVRITSFPHPVSLTVVIYSCIPCVVAESIERGPSVWEIGSLLSSRVKPMT